MPTVRALSKFVLAFGCQQNLLPIVSELREPTPPRVLLVCVAAISIADFVPSKNELNICGLSPPLTASSGVMP